MAEPGEALTEREREIVTLVATGATNRMIAHRLRVSPNTVKVHLRNVFAKLEINSRTEATVIAIREGWVTVGDEPGDGLAPPPSALPAETPPVDAREQVKAAAAMALEQARAAAASALPSLRWPRRLYLVFSTLLVVAVTALAWPRTSSLTADTCVNEFTAECTAGSGPLPLAEPESLWVSGAPMPEPRGRFGMVSLAGKLYVIGGETDGGVVGTVAVYDPAADRWQPAADKPTPAANLLSVAVENRIYALGGSDQQGEPLDVVEVYDPASDTWSQGVPLPTPLAAHAGVVWNGRVYVFGGSNGAGYAGVALLYSLEDETWRELAPMPTPRGFAGAAVIRDQIVVIGGYDGQREFGVCERFDPLLGVWQSCPSLAAPRGGIGVETVAGQVYVIGGGWTSFVTFSERYNPHSDSWYNVETPLLLSGGEWRNLGVARVGTRVYALGGWQSGRYLAINLAYETLPNRLYLPAAAGE